MRAPTKKRSGPGAWRAAVGVFALWATACDGDDHSIVPDPRQGLIVERPSCDVALDADVITRTIAITHLAVPEPGAAPVGVNLDQLDNNWLPVGLGPTVAGCGERDFAGGIDNSAAVWLPSFESFFWPLDVQSALVASYSTTGVANDPVGAFTMQIELAHLAALDASDDPCVEVVLRQTRANGETTMVRGSGALVGHRLIAFSNDAFALPIQMPPFRQEDCIDRLCVAAELDVAVSLPTFDLRLDDANAEILALSTIAGVIFMDDAEYVDSVREAGLAASLGNFAVSAHLDANALKTTIDFFSAARDIHLDQDGSLRTCTGPSPAAVDANGISIGLAIDSL
jgi:hypothetical protein